jgi:hypothetical protein
VLLDGLGVGAGDDLVLGFLAQVAAEAALDELARGVALAEAGELGLDDEGVEALAELLAVGLGGILDLELLAAGPGVLDGDLVGAGGRFGGGGGVGHEAAPRG